MAVCGIDLGNQNAVIAQAGRGGVDIILNDNSKRLTPSLVSFVGDERYLGEQATTQVRTNMANTVAQLKRIIGRKFSEPDIAYELAEHINYKLVPLEGDEIGIEVMYDGRKQVFTPVQVLAMFFTKMKETIQMKNPGVTTADVVLSVPAYYTDAQRGAVADAATIAGLNCLRLMNEGTAAALSYGIYKSAKKEFPEGVETKIAFLDMGDAHFTCTIAGFTNTALRILASESDSSIGGREIDLAIAKYFADEFKAKTHIDAWADRKTRIKLMVAAEKAKTTITPFGVNTTNVSVECLKDDRDFSGSLTIEKMDELCAPMMDKMAACMQRALAAAGIAATSDLATVELVGGGMRPRVVKRRAAQVLGMTLNESTGHGLSTSMNLDECIARGCALACAALTPVFRVKPYDTMDIIPYPIRVTWDPATGADTTAGGSGATNPEAMEDEEAGAPTTTAAAAAATTMILFKAGEGTPLTRRITFKRTAGFTITVEYDADATLPVGAARLLRKYHIDIPAEALEGVGEGGAPKLRVDFRHDMNGQVSLVKAEILKEIKEAPAPEVAPPAPADGDVKMDGSSVPAPAEGEAAAPKAKKRYRRMDARITTVFNCGHMTPDAVAAAASAESAMKARDDDIHATHDQRNSLEAYIYATRDAMYGDLADFGSSEAKETLSAALEEGETWLYDNMEADRAAFADKLAALKALGDPLYARKWEADNRVAAGNTLLAAVDEYRSVINNRDGKHGHLSDSDRDVMRAACSEAETWFRNLQEAQAGLQLYHDPVLKVADIHAKGEALIRELRPIANKPVPAPAPAPAAPPPAPAEGGDAASEAAPGPAGGETKMDVDASA